MTFTISICDGDSTTVYRQADLRMSDVFANLLTWIEKHSAATHS